jgi:hypothetical protein
VITWEHAFGAYGPARGGDELLEVLRRGDEEAYAETHPGTVWWRQPYSFLWSALYCGGRITPATVLGLTGLAPAVTADDFGGEDSTLRWAAVWWIRDVTRVIVADTDLYQARLTATRRNEPAVREWLNVYLRQERSIFDWGQGDEPGRVLVAAAKVDCFDALPEIFAPVSSLIAPQQPEQLRMAAASAAAMLVRHPRLHGHREAITAYHLAEAAHGTPLYRASMVLGLAELDGPTEQWMHHPQLRMRMCAALAPRLAEDAEAIRVLRSASLNPSALDRAFGDFRLHQLPWPNLAVAEALCDRVQDFDTLLDSATAAVAYTGVVGDGVLCEPYLRKAFPQGLPHGGTDEQRALARAIADHDSAWRDDKKWATTFVRTNLPADREAWLSAAG